MLRNYLKIALRSLIKNKVSTLVNIIGLAISMAAFVLIIQYVRYELSYDRFHRQSDRIFRVQQDRYNKGLISTQWAAGCSAVGQSLYENFDEVEGFTRFTITDGVFSQGETKFREEQVYLADTSFFELFSFEVLLGDPATALREPLVMFLSESTAAKYFGNTDPIGESLRFNGGPEVRVVGLFRDAPENSHLKPKMVISWETLVHFRGPDINTAWQWDGFFNYLLLHPESDPEQLEAKIPAFVQETIGEDLENSNSGVIFNLQPLRSIHLHSDFMFEAEPNGNATTVYALIVVAFFLVIIAWINYINLASARSLERAREVGMRKVTGAFRSHLVSQFMVESFLLNLVAILTSVILVLLTGPLFNQLTGKELDYSITFSPGFWALIVLLFTVGAMISGIYPALLLSSFKPTTVFQGKSALKVGGMGLRRLLVVFQFTTTLLLLAGTLTVYYQVFYMKNQDLGVDMENVLVLRGPSVNDSTYAETFSAFKSEILRNPVIEMVSASTGVPGRQPKWNAGGIRRITESDDKGNQYRILGFDFEFVDFYGLEILEGRNFSEDFGRNSETVMFNEAAIDLMGFGDFSSAMNVPILFWGDTFEIVGVVKNYHQEGLKEEFEPLIFRFFRDPNGYYSLKVKQGMNQEAMAFAEQQWETFFPENPFEYFFLEDYYNEQYREETRFGTVFGLFAFLAILVACLGLFGLSSYTTLQRAREIGLRKVLGSTSGNAVLILIRFFLIQVLIAVPVGLGLGYFFMSDWLQNYAYRISIGWWFFVVPLLLVLVITLLTVSSQVWKTANLNPSESIRYE